MKTLSSFSQTHVKIAPQVCCSVFTRAMQCEFIKIPAFKPFIAYLFIFQQPLRQAHPQEGPHHRHRFHQVMVSAKRERELLQSTHPASA